MEAEQCLETGGDNKGSGRWKGGSCGAFRSSRGGPLFGSIIYTGQQLCVTCSVMVSIFDGCCCAVCPTELCQLLHNCFQSIPQQRTVMVQQHTIRACYHGKRELKEGRQLRGQQQQFCCFACCCLDCLHWGRRMKENHQACRAGGTCTAGMPHIVVC